MFSRFINYDSIAQAYSMNPFDVPKKFTTAQIEFLIAKMYEENKYEEQEMKKASR